jgi:hypothetical protein
MKLVKQTPDGWLYQLNQPEANCLRNLLSQFPITANAPAKISRTDSDPQTVEREKLLDESLADHRKELKQIARGLIGADKFKAWDKGWRLCINSEEREILLQILNDIRVGSWRALGEPENLETQAPNPTKTEQVSYNILNLAGYFEHQLLNLEEADS